MKTIILSACLAVGAAGAVSIFAADADSSDTHVYVKDSIITTKVKTKLAAKHMATLTKVKVDTDADGVVWLSGSVPTKDAKDLAEMIAKDTDGVQSVHNKIMVE